jgi:hypothetical protein
LPEGLLLFDFLLFVEGKFHAERKVCDTVPVEDVVTEDGVFVDIEVEAEILYAKPVECFSFTIESPDHGTIGTEAFGRDGAERFHKLHLLKFAEFVQFSHALVAEVKLIHDGRDESVSDGDGKGKVKACLQSREIPREVVRGLATVHKDLFFYFLKYSFRKSCYTIRY